MAGHSPHAVSNFSAVATLDVMYVLLLERARAVDHATMLQGEHATDRESALDDALGIWHWEEVPDEDDGPAPNGETNIVRLSDWVENANWIADNV